MDHDKMDSYPSLVESRGLVCLLSLFIFLSEHELSEKKTHVSRTHSHKKDFSLKKKAISNFIVSRSDPFVFY